MSTTLTSLSCRTCGTELSAPVGKRRPATYCSIKCKRRDQRASTERRIPCATCSTEFTTRRPDGKYCSPACRNPDAQRCTEEGCERPVLAKGLCGMDWGRRYGKRAKAMVPCTVCGTEAEKDADTRRRSVCSPECRRFLRFGYWPACVVPDTHPVLSTRIPCDHPVRRKPQMDWVDKTYRIYIPECRWCGKAFVTQQPHHALCSKRCTRREAKAKRKALEHGVGGSYTWTEVVALFLKFDRCCAYCRQEVDGQPDPDHVVPLSRGGSNSITNILPSCSMCNSDKRDLLLHEWALDRQRRHLPPRITKWRRGDPLYTHLAIIQDHERTHTA
jgi:endogenous inhibitor of DNA gyrase (YacG/DUF329 family)